MRFGTSKSEPFAVVMLVQACSICLPGLNAPPSLHILVLLSLTPPYPESSFLAFLDVSIKTIVDPGGVTKVRKQCDTIFSVGSEFDKIM